MVKRESKKASASAGPSLSHLPRLKKLNKKQTKKLAKRNVANRPAIPGSFSHTRKTFALLAANWQLFAWLTAVYMVLNIIFASGISNLGLSIDNLQSTLEEAAEGNYGKITAALGGFGALVGSGGSSTSQTASVLQTVIIILESLVIIWALRHVMAGRKIGVKEAYYNATDQLVPFLLVLFVVIIQILPLSLGLALFQFTALNFSAGAALLVGLIFLGLAIWSLRMLSSSVFALYIVTLPDMQPREALRSAKKIVRFRRLQIIRRLLFLPLFLLVAMGAITIPLIMVASFLVAPVFYILSAIAIVFVHSYIYGLYRSLISEG